VQGRYEKEAATEKGPVREPCGIFVGKSRFSLAHPSVFFLRRGKGEEMVVVPFRGLGHLRVPLVVRLVPYTGRVYLPGWGLRGKKEGKLFGQQHGRIVAGWICRSRALPRDLSVPSGYGEI